MRTCYYEVLGVERKAKAGEIKKAYHKAALKWHPDKNVGNVEEATDKFKEAHNAYAVLSDPQERAWYDSHRESILREGAAAGAADGDDDDGGQARSLGPKELLKFFDSGCYDGFDDAERGFYAVYRRLFARLDEEEEGEEDETTYHTAAAGFGASGAAHAEVGAFYREWGNFVTLKQFHNVDKFNPRDAPDRHNRRAMEAENKKLRRKARKDFMDTVHNLVYFIKKRDPRVKAMEKAAAKQKQEEEKLAKLRKEEAKAEKLRANEALREESARAAEEREAELRALGMLDGESDDEEGEGSDEEEEQPPVCTPLVACAGAVQACVLGCSHGRPCMARSCSSARWTSCSTTSSRPTSAPHRAPRLPRPRPLRRRLLRLHRSRPSGARRPRRRCGVRTPWRHSTSSGRR